MRIYLAVLLACLLLCAGPARAAESYANCTGYIDSVPAVITTQGTWCLRQDVSSAVTSGELVLVATNNVTIDCNDFKIGGLAAGPGTGTEGIRAASRAGVTIRNCNIRGFLTGINLEGGSGGGHVVEDNRLELNTLNGILSTSPQIVVRNNLVKDTGGYDASANYGIYVSSGTVLDNIVDGILVEGGTTDPIGIRIGSTSIARGNIIRGVGAIDSGLAYGIAVVGTNSFARDNDVIGLGAASEVGIYCAGNTSTARDNTFANVVTGVSGCAVTGNYANPN